MQTEVLERVGRYEIIGELGAGSMSRVFLAHDPNLDRQVAVKVVLRGFSLDRREQSELERRFLLEARAAGKLSHPGIVRVYDADKDTELGIPYIAMEWVQGRSLRNLLDEGGRLDGSHTLDILSQVARALEYAHRAGRIHRDIKPSNILIGTDGVAKVSDFGVAKIVSETHTVSGQILGTPAYMSPEQVKDEPLDGRSDLFSLGAVLYQCVSGSTPFGGDSLVQVVYKILNVDPRPLNLPATPILDDLAAVTDRALRKNPNLRFQTGAEFAEALDRLRDGLATTGPISFQPASPVTVPVPLDTVPGIDLRAPAGRPVRADKSQQTRTHTVQLSTTSIHRATGRRAIPPGDGFDPDPHGTVIAGAAAARPPRRRALVVGLVMALVVASVLVAFGLASRTEPEPTGTPIEVVRWSASPHSGLYDQSPLRFPDQPAPDPQPRTLFPPAPEPEGDAPPFEVEQPVVELPPADGSRSDAGVGTEASQDLVDPPLPPTVLTPVTIRYKHKGGAAFLSVSIDGQRVWSQELRAVEGKLQRLMGYEARAVVPVPSGTHTLHISLSDPSRDIEASGSIRSRYTSGARRTLRVSVDPGSASMQLRWKE